jgi:hypothetical protein
VGRARWLAELAAGVLLAALVSVAGAGPAAASPRDCDASFRPDVYRDVGGGSSFTAYNRTVYLVNGSAFNFSQADIRAGLHIGDLVWIDRSLRGMPGSLPVHPSTRQVTANGGWKQCGPFNAFPDRVSRLVMNWNTRTRNHFATRACMRPGDGRPSVCGRWYIDRS